jgi:hypothetical protein
VAIASLVEQGSTTLAELNDNYRYGRRLVGEHLLALIRQDIGREQTEVAVGVQKPDKTKMISLNMPVKDDFNNTVISNDVYRSKTQVALDDIQATAGYRAQVSNRLFELASSLPDDVKVAVLDIVVDSTDIPQREEMVKRIRKVTGTGVNPDDMTEEERAAMEQQQAVDDERKALELEELRQKVANLRSAATKNESTATNLDAKTEAQKYQDRKTDAETDKILLEMRELTQQMQAHREGMEEKIRQGEATLKAYESVIPDVMALKASNSAQPKAREIQRPGAE